MFVMTFIYIKSNQCFYVAQNHNYMAVGFTIFTVSNKALLTD